MAITGGNIQEQDGKSEAIDRLKAIAGYVEVIYYRKQLREPVKLTLQSELEEVIEILQKNKS